MYKQIIIARKDLHLSPGKLSSQVSHGSMAFITNMIQEKAYAAEWTGLQTTTNDADIYIANLRIDVGLYEKWIDGDFTKCVLEAKNRKSLLKAKTMAEEMGMKEEEDFFLIRDNCYTELMPEEDGRTLTVIGFRPMESDIIDKIGRKYNLYR